MHTLVSSHDNVELQSNSKFSFANNNEKVLVKIKQFAVAF